MSASSPALMRVILVSAFIALAVAACGRRGALQPPPDPSAPKGTEQKAATSDDDDDDGEATGVVPSPVPGGGKKKPKGFTIPQRPFILDPLL